MLPSKITRYALVAAAALHAMASAQSRPNVTVFFTDGHPATALSAGSVSLSGTDIHSLLDHAPVNKWGMALDRRRCHLYLPIDHQRGVRIDRVNLNGAGRTSLRSPPWSGFQPRGVDIDPVGGRLYFHSPGTPTRIGSMRLDGSGARKMVQYNAMTPSVQPRSIHVDPVGKKVYWYDAALPGFRRCNLDGSKLEDVLTTPHARSQDVDVVNGFFYWTVQDKLYKAPINRTASPRVILTEPLVFRESCLAVEPSQDVIVWMASAAEIRYTMLSSPGTVRKSAPLPGQKAIPWGSFEVMPGPRVGLSVTPSEVRANDPFTFDVCGGLPSGPYGLFLVTWNQFRVLSLLTIGVLDAHGKSSLTLITPPGLQGNSSQWSAAALDALGQVVLTLPVPLIFR